MRPARAMLLHLACVVTGLGVCLAGALWLGRGELAHVALGALFFAPGANRAGYRVFSVKRNGGRTVSPSLIST